MNEKAFYLDWCTIRPNLFRLRNLNAAAHFPRQYSNIRVRTPGGRRPTGIPIAGEATVINGEKRTKRGGALGGRSGNGRLLRYYAANFNFKGPGR